MQKYNNLSFLGVPQSTAVIKLIGSKSENCRKAILAVSDTVGITDKKYNNSSVLYLFEDFCAKFEEGQDSRYVIFCVVFKENSDTEHTKMVLEYTIKEILKNYMLMGCVCLNSTGSDVTDVLIDLDRKYLNIVCINIDSVKRQKRPKYFGNLLYVRADTLLFISEIKKQKIKEFFARNPSTKK